MEKKPSNPDNHSAIVKNPVPGPTPTPSGLHKEIMELLNLFRDMVKRYGDLAGRINSVDSAASNVYAALVRIQERLKKLFNRDVPGLTELIAFSAYAGTLPRHIVDILIRSAENGVTSFSSEWLANGKAVFEIEGKCLTLSPRLADLLIVLSGNHGPSENGLVGWKSVEELEQSVLGPKRGWPPKDAAEQKKYRQTIRQSILRLRDSFSNAGMNRYLIQENPRFGYRFALKRRDHSGDAGNPP